MSYYSKGAVAGFLLDAEIRRATKNRRSLDDVMRIMFKRFEKDGYLPEDFRAVVDEVAGTEMAEWFKTHIDTPSPMQYENALAWYGLTFGDEKKAGATDEQGDEKKDDDKRKPWVGFSGGTSVSRVESGSPAARSGINVGDEIIAVDGYRVSSGSIDSRLKQYKVGDTIKVLTSRRQQIFERKLTLAKAPKSLKLKWVKEPNDLQKASAKAWLMLTDEEEKEDKK